MKKGIKSSEGKVTLFPSQWKGEDKWEPPRQLGLRHARPVLYSRPPVLLANLGSTEQAELDSTHPGEIQRTPLFIKDYPQQIF